MTDLTNPIFNDEEAARKHFEAMRWPDGPVCPHCGVDRQRDRVEGQEHPARRLQVQGLREALHRDGRHHRTSGRISRCTNGCWRRT